MYGPAIKLINSGALKSTGFIKCCINSRRTSTAAKKIEILAGKRIQKNLIPILCN